MNAEDAALEVWERHGFTANAEQTRALLAEL
jgi:hypothetical protein